MANTSSPIILWCTPAMASVMPLSKPFEPVRIWDNDARTFKDGQAVTDDGVPIWEAEALLQVGWGRTNTPVKLRMSAALRPDVVVDPMKIVEALGLGSLSAGGAALASTISTVGVTSQPLHKKS